MNYIKLTNYLIKSAKIILISGVGDILVYKNLFDQKPINLTTEAYVVVLKYSLLGANFTVVC